MNIKNFVILGLIIVVLSSCATCRYNEKTAIKTTVFEIVKTPCFGKCPVYKMFVFTDGTVLYEGLNFVDNIGLYTNQLSKTEYANLCKVFKKSKWNELKDEYTGDLPDLARTTITKHDKKASKTVLAQYNIPTDFKKVEKEMIKIANKQDGWDAIPRGTSIDNDWSSNEFIVKLNNESAIKELESKYSNIELKMIKKIAPDLNYWIFIFNNQKAASSLAYFLLKNESIIEEVQFNRLLEMR